MTTGEIRLFRTLWHTSNDNMFVVRREPNSDYINEKSNPALKQTFNLGQEEIDGVSLKELLDDVIYKKVVSRYDECIAKNIPLTYEERHIIDDSGERFWITTITPSIDTKDNMTRIFGISREVTAIHHAEKVLKEHNEILEKEVKERTLRLNDTLVKMEKLAVTDKLTKLYNRHKIDEVLNHEISRAERYNTSFGVLMLDIDNFKKINDDFGHYTGDAVLKELASILSKLIRESDMVGRWGGEEFLIVFPGSDKDSVVHFAQRLRETVQDHRFDIVERITASIGLTLYLNNDTAESLVLRVDEALYRSKNSGRNCVNFN